MKNANSSHDMIAVIGMACRMPGGEDPESFFGFLMSGRDAAAEVPSDRWNAKDFYDPDPAAPGKTDAQRAGFLPGSPYDFDAHFFNVPAPEALQMDPQHRMLLEVSWEAFEDAAIDINRLKGSQTGVYLGITSDDYAAASRHAPDPGLIDAYTLTGTVLSPAAGRLSYIYGFHGPSMSIDTACSSSLVAMNLACRALEGGECDLALAGGVSLILSPIFHICSTKLRNISPDGRSKAFDASADGYGRGEGCGLVVLKRFEDARQDGDRIMAVIRGSGVNQDGRSAGLAAPNGRAQEMLIRTVLSRSGLEASDIDYIEAHGTGTRLGDPIELHAIGAVMNDGHDKDHPVIVGSVKSNVGHLEAAAGVTSAIKIVEALRHEAIPPSLHFRTPNPEIRWKDMNVRIAAEPVPWSRGDRTRRAGVNSFGFSGTNAFMIFEEAPPEAQAAAKPARPVHVLPISGRKQEAVKCLGERYLAFIKSNPSLSAADLCHTAAAGRAHHSLRKALVGATAEELLERLKELVNAPDAGRSRDAERPAPRIAFLFTGQGSQYVGMARGLYEHHPVFRKTLDACAALLDRELDRPLLDLIYGDGASEEELARTCNNQPAIFSIQHALCRLLASWGVKPDFLAGHSIGEYAAAVEAGVLGLEEALRLVVHRGRLMQAVTEKGSMAAIFCEEEALADLLRENRATVSIAAINAPGVVILSGKEQTVELIIATLAQRKISSTRLKVSHAFHSPLMEKAADDFLSIARGATYAPPRLPLFSTVAAAEAPDGVMNSAEYWSRQIRKPVLFKKTVEALRAAGANIFLEIGSTPTLSGMAQSTLKDESCRYLSCLKPKEDDWRRICTTAAALYEQGVEIDWKEFDRPFSCRPMRAPLYPFQRKRFFMDPISRPSASMVGPSYPAASPVLGSRITTPAAPGAVIFQNVFRAGAPAFLEEHRILGRMISPAAAHVFMMAAAARTLRPSNGCLLENVEFLKPLVIDEDQARVVQLIVEAGGGRNAARLVSRPDDAASDDWVTHCTADLSFSAPEAPPLPSRAEIEARCPSSMTIEELYGFFEKAGYVLGPNFRRIQTIRYGSDEILCELSAADSLDGFLMHPGLIDSFIQTGLPVCVPRADTMFAGDRVVIPLSMGALVALGPLEGPLTCHNRIQVRKDILQSTITVRDAADRKVFEIRDMILKLTDRKTLYRDLGAGHENLLYAPAWKEIAAKDLPHRSDQTRSSFVILSGDRSPSLDAVATKLAGAGIGVSHHDGDAAFIEKAGAVHPDASFSIIHAIGGEDTAQDDLPNRVVQFMGREALAIVQALVRMKATHRAALWFLTTGMETIDSSDTRVSLRASAIRGFVRTLAIEYPELHAGAIDLEQDPSEAAVQEIVDLVTTRSPERMLAIRGGRIFGERLLRMREALRAESRLSLPSTAPDQNWRLDKSPRGLLDELHFSVAPRTVPRKGEIEIRVRATGLNFKDVLVALNQYPGDVAMLGFDCCGVVTSVGEGVDRLKAGDAVMLFGAPGCMGKYVTADARQAVKKPESLTFEEAVTIPAAFLTAHYAFTRIGKLKKGERVLVHAGAGGVGMAAIQLARRLGCEVFATAGSDRKRALLSSMGVEHLYSSRDTSFAEKIGRITSGQGVDVVLNSLTGEFITKSLSLLAPGGRFLEMGKREILDPDWLARNHPAIAYHPFDLSAVAAADPDLGCEMLEELLAGFAAGELTPLPRTIFEIEDAPAAFRYMSQARHVGKIIISQGEVVRREAARGAGPIRRDGTYLVTGGLGALGLRIAERLVGAGAVAVVLASRRAPSSEVMARIDAMRGASAVEAMQCDVASRDDVARAVARISSSLPPLRGVIHAAGLLDDGIAGEQDERRFEAVMRPKVAGTWNLHRETERLDLDFFVCFSSIASLLGNAGQSNYASANSFMDGFARFRRAAGLSGMSIEWGPWAEEGMATGVAAQKLTAQGVRLLDPETCLDVLMRLLEDQPVQAGVMDIDWRAYCERHGIETATGFYSRLGLSGRGGAEEPAKAKESPADTLKQLADTPESKRPKLMLSLLQKMAKGILGYGDAETIESDRPLSEQGFDSLMSVELRNRMSKAFAKPLPASLLFDHPTLNKLSAFMLTEVLDLGPAAALPVDTSSTEYVLGQIDALLRNP
ncbi:MAG: type I polyketide synthase [Acidobacteriota bacterium]